MSGEYSSAARSPPEECLSRSQPIAPCSIPWLWVWDLWSPERFHVGRLYFCLQSLEITRGGKGVGMDKWQESTGKWIEWLSSLLLQTQNSPSLHVLDPVGSCWILIFQVSRPGWPDGRVPLVTLPKYLPKDLAGQSVVNVKGLGRGGTGPFFAWHWRRYATNTGGIMTYRIHRWIMTGWWFYIASHLEKY